LEHELGIDKAAVITSAVGKLGVAALRAAHVMDGSQRMVRAALALAGLADALDGLHERLLWAQNARNFPKTSNGGDRPPCHLGASTLRVVPIHVKDTPLWRESEILIPRILLILIVILALIFIRRLPVIARAGKGQMRMKMRIGT